MYSGFSKYDVYTECGSLYCYKDSNVLRNKYNIRSQKKLKEVEQDVSGAKQQYLLNHPIRGRFTTNHLCNIHRFLFEDIYPFAGHLRRETIKKGDTTFLNEKEIPARLHKLLDGLKQENYLLESPYEKFIERLAYYLAELNYIHPFREGNGRSIREFIRQLIALNEYEVNWSAVSVDDLLFAMVQSVYDISLLKNILRIPIKKIK